MTATTSSTGQVSRLQQTTERLRHETSQLRERLRGERDAVRALRAQHAAELRAERTAARRKRVELQAQLQEVNKTKNALGSTSTTCEQCSKNRALHEAEIRKLSAEFKKKEQQLKGQLNEKSTNTSLVLVNSCEQCANTKALHEADVRKLTSEFKKKEQQLKGQLNDKVAPTIISASAYIASCEQCAKFKAMHDAELRKINVEFKKKEHQLKCQLNELRKVASVDSTDGGIQSCHCQRLTVDLTKQKEVTKDLEERLQKAIDADRLKAADLRAQHEKHVVELSRITRANRHDAYKLLEELKTKDRIIAQLRRSAGKARTKGEDAGNEHAQMRKLREEVRKNEQPALLPPACDPKHETVTNHDKFRQNEVESNVTIKQRDQMVCGAANEELIEHPETDTDSAVSSAPSSLSPQPCSPATAVLRDHATPPPTSLSPQPSEGYTTPPPGLWPDLENYDDDEGVNSELAMAKRQVRELERALLVTRATKSSSRHVTALSERVRQLEDREAELLRELGDLREQNELLEFRVLELAECPDKSSLSTSTWALSEHRDVATATDDVPERLNDEPVRRRITDICNKTDNTEDKRCLMQVLMLLHGLDELSRRTEIYDAEAAMQIYNERELTPPVSLMSARGARDRTGPDRDRLIAKVPPFTGRTAESDDDRETPLRSHESSTSPTPVNSRGTQTDATEDTTEEENSTKSLNLTTEVRKLDKLRETIDRNGRLVVSGTGCVGGCEQKHLKQLEFYRERADVLERKLCVYESSGELQARQLAERLSREVRLEAQVKQLTTTLNKLQSENSRLEEERCELEEAENDTRLHCQRLEADILQLERSKMAAKRRSRESRQQAAYWENMVSKYEERNYELEERECELRHRLEVMEKTAPAILLFNMWKMMQDDPKLDVASATLSKLKRAGSRGRSASSGRSKSRSPHRIPADCPCSGGGGGVDEQIRNLEDQRNKLVEAKQDMEKKVHILESQLNELKQSASNTISPSSSSAPVSGPSATSLMSGDFELITAVHELKERENDMRKRIEELEKREAAYMETLQQADEIWAEMETGYKKRISDAEQSEANMRDRLRRLEKREPVNYDELDNAERELAAQTQRLSRENIRLQTEKKRLENELQCLCRMRDEKSRELESRMDRIRGELEYERRRSQALEQRLSDGEAALSEASRAHSAETEALRERLARTANELVHLEVTNGELREEVDTLEGKITEVERGACQRAATDEQVIRGLSQELNDRDRELAGMKQQDLASRAGERLGTALQGVKTCEVCSQSVSPNLVQAMEGVRTLCNLISHPSSRPPDDSQVRFKSSRTCNRPTCGRIKFAPAPKIKDTCITEICEKFILEHKFASKQAAETETKETVGTTKLPSGPSSKASSVSKLSSVDLESSAKTSKSAVTDSPITTEDEGDDLDTIQATAGDTIAVVAELDTTVDTAQVDGGDNIDTIQATAGDTIAVVAELDTTVDTAQVDGGDDIDTIQATAGDTVAVVGELDTTVDIAQVDGGDDLDTIQATAGDTVAVVGELDTTVDTAQVERDSSFKKSTKICPKDRSPRSSVTSKCVKVSCRGTCSVISKDIPAIVATSPDGNEKLLLDIKSPKESEKITELCPMAAKLPSTKSRESTCTKSSCKAPCFTSSRVSFADQAIFLADKPSAITEVDQYDLLTEVMVAGQPEYTSIQARVDMDTEHEIDAVTVMASVTKSGNLELTTESPPGLIEHTMMYTPSGNMEITTGFVPREEAEEMDEVPSYFQPEEEPLPPDIESSEKPLVTSQDAVSAEPEMASEEQAGQEPAATLPDAGGDTAADETSSALPDAVDTAVDETSSTLADAGDTAADETSSTLADAGDTAVDETAAGLADAGDTAVDETADAPSDAGDLAIDETADAPSDAGGLAVDDTVAGLPDAGDTAVDETAASLSKADEELSAIDETAEQVDAISADKSVDVADILSDRGEVTEADEKTDEELSAIDEIAHEDAATIRSDAISAEPEILSEIIAEKSPDEDAATLLDRGEGAYEETDTSLHDGVSTEPGILSEIIADEIDDGKPQSTHSSSSDNGMRFEKTFVKSRPDFDAMSYTESIVEKQYKGDNVSMSIAPEPMPADESDMSKSTIAELPSVLMKSSLSGGEIKKSEAGDGGSLVELLKEVAHSTEKIAEIISRVSKSPSKSLEEMSERKSKESSEIVSKVTEGEKSQESIEIASKETEVEKSEESIEMVSKETVVKKSKESSEKISKQTEGEKSIEPTEIISKETEGEKSKESTEILSKGTGEKISKVSSKEASKEKESVESADNISAEVETIASAKELEEESVTTSVYSEECDSLKESVTKSEEENSMEETISGETKTVAFEIHEETESANESNESYHAEEEQPILKELIRDALPKKKICACSTASQTLDASQKKSESKSESTQSQSPYSKSRSPQSNVVEDPQNTCASTCIVLQSPPPRNLCEKYSCETYTKQGEDISEAGTKEKSITTSEEASTIGALEEESLEEPTEEETTVAEESIEKSAEDGTELEAYTKQGEEDIYESVRDAVPKKKICACSTASQTLDASQKKSESKSRSPESNSESPQSQSPESKSESPQSQSPHSKSRSPESKSESPQSQSPHSKSRSPESKSEGAISCKPCQIGTAPISQTLDVPQAKSEGSITCTCPVGILPVDLYSQPQGSQQLICVCPMYENQQQQPRQCIPPNVFQGGPCPSQQMTQPQMMQPQMMQPQMTQPQMMQPQMMQPPMMQSQMPQPQMMQSPMMPPPPQAMPYFQSYVPCPGWPCSSAPYGFGYGAPVPLGAQQFSPVPQQMPYQNVQQQMPYQNAQQQMPYQNAQQQMPYQNAQQQMPYQNAQQQMPYQNAQQEIPYPIAQDQVPYQNIQDQDPYQNAQQPVLNVEEPVLNQNIKDPQDTCASTCIVSQSPPPPPPPPPLNLCEKYSCEAYTKQGEEDLSEAGAKEASEEESKIGALEEESLEEPTEEETTFAEESIEKSAEDSTRLEEEQYNEGGEAYESTAGTLSVSLVVSVDEDGSKSPSETVVSERGGSADTSIDKSFVSAGDDTVISAVSGELASAGDAMTSAASGEVALTPTPVGSKSPGFEESNKSSTGSKKTTSSGSKIPIAVSPTRSSRSREEEILTGTEGKTTPKSGSGIPSLKSGGSGKTSPKICGSVTSPKSAGSGKTSQKDTGSGRTSQKDTGSGRTSQKDTGSGKSSPKSNKSGTPGTSAKESGRTSPTRKVSMESRGSRGVKISFHAKDCSCKECKCAPCKDPKIPPRKRPDFDALYPEVECCPQCFCEVCRCKNCIDPRRKDVPPHAAGLPCDCEECECAPCKDPNILTKKRQTPESSKSRRRSSQISDMQVPKLPATPESSKSRRRSSQISDTQVPKLSATPLDTKYEVVSLPSGQKPPDPNFFIPQVTSSLERAPLPSPATDEKRSSVTFDLASGNILAASAPATSPDITAAIPLAAPAPVNTTVLLEPRDYTGASSSFYSTTADAELADTTTGSEWPSTTTDSESPMTTLDTSAPTDLSPTPMTITFNPPDLGTSTEPDTTDTSGEDDLLNMMRGVGQAPAAAVPPITMTTLDTSAPTDLSPTPMTITFNPPDLGTSTEPDTTDTSGEDDLLNMMRGVGQAPAAAVPPIITPPVLSPTATSTSAVSPSGPSTPTSMTTSIPAPFATSAPEQMATSIPAPMATSTPIPMAISIPEPFETSIPAPMATSTPIPMAISTPEPFETSIPAPFETSAPTPIETSAPTPMATPAPFETSAPTPMATTIPTPMATSIPTPMATSTPIPTAEICPFTQSIQVGGRTIDIEYPRSATSSRTVNICPSGHPVDCKCIQCICNPCSKNIPTRAEMTSVRIQGATGNLTDESCICEPPTETTLRDISICPFEKSIKVADRQIAIKYPIATVSSKLVNICPVGHPVDCQCIKCICDPCSKNFTSQPNDLASARQGQAITQTTGGSGAPCPFTQSVQVGGREINIQYPRTATSSRTVNVCPSGHPVDCQCIKCICDPCSKNIAGTSKSTAPAQSTPYEDIIPHHLQPEQFGSVTYIKKAGAVIAQNTGEIPCPFAQSVQVGEPEITQNTCGGGAPCPFTQSVQVGGREINIQYPRPATSSRTVNVCPSGHPVDCQCIKCICDPCSKNIAGAEKPPCGEMIPHHLEQEQLGSVTYIKKNDAVNAQNNREVGAPCPFTQSVQVGGREINIQYPRSATSSKTVNVCPSGHPVDCQCIKCICDPCSKNIPQLASIAYVKKHDPYSSSTTSSHDGPCTCGPSVQPATMVPSPHRTAADEPCTCEPLVQPATMVPSATDEPYIYGPSVQPDRTATDEPCTCWPSVQPATMVPSASDEPCTCGPPVQPSTRSAANSRGANEGTSGYSAPRRDLQMIPHSALCDCPECKCNPCAPPETVATKLPSSKLGPALFKATVKPSESSKYEFEMMIGQKAPVRAVAMTGTQDLRNLDTETLKRKLTEIENEAKGRANEIAQIRKFMSGLQSQCTCGQTDLMTAESRSFEQTISGLQCALAFLQEKCRKKDRMITAFTEELRLRTGSGVFDSVLHKIAAQKDVQTTSPDYDRTGAAKVLPTPGDMKSRQVMRTPAEKPCAPVKPAIDDGCKCSSNAPKNVDPSPLAVTEVRRIAPDSLLLKWERPASQDIRGYEVEVNGEVKSRVHSAGRNATVLNGLVINGTMNLAVIAISVDGDRCSPAANAVYQPHEPSPSSQNVKGQCVC